MAESLKFIGRMLIPIAMIAALVGCVVDTAFVRAVDAYDKAMWPVTEREVARMPEDEAAAARSLHNAHRAMIDETLSVIGEE